MEVNTRVLLLLLLNYLPPHNVIIDFIVHPYRELNIKCDWTPATTTTTATWNWKFKRPQARLGSPPRDVVGCSADVALTEQYYSFEKQNRQNVRGDGFAQAQQRWQQQQQQ